MAEGSKRQVLNLILMALMFPLAELGDPGLWLLDPNDFEIGSTELVLLPMPLLMGMTYRFWSTRARV